MPCWTVVKVPLEMDIKGNNKDIEEALNRMGYGIDVKREGFIRADNVTLTKTGDSWRLSTPNKTFDRKKFIQEMSRAKILNEAKRKNYKVIQDEIDKNGNLLMRMMVR